MFLNRLVNSNLAFAIVAAIFIISVGIVSVVRGGNDLKVDIYGAEEVQANRSPYVNAVDPDRPLFRYAPPFAIMLYPFLAVNKLFNVPLIRYNPIGDLQYHNIAFTVGAFYIAKVLMLIGSAFLLLNIMPPADRKKGWANLKIAFALASPFIAYELANNQNKLMALFFMLCSVALLERSRPWLSGIFFNLAAVVYIPIAAFIIYFLKYNKFYILILVVTALIVFIIIPSIIIGFDYNNHLIKEWYTRCLKPFFFGSSYSAYVELRKNSQSLPSAVGRLFSEKIPHGARYYIEPRYINIIIRIFSILIIMASALAVWLSPHKTRGLSYCAALILPLILPSYCLVYTWSYLFVIYFFILNYINSPRVDKISRNALLFSSAAVFLSTCLMVIEKTFYLSFLFWATLALLSSLIYAMFKTRAKTA